MKSTGITTGQVVRALVNTIQFKVGPSFTFYNKKYIGYFQFQIFPLVSENLGLGSVFFIISVINILAAIFYKILLPKTRNKTVSELQKIFAKDPENLSEAYSYDNPLHRIDTQVFE